MTTFETSLLLNQRVSFSRGMRSDETHIEALADKGDANAVLDLKEINTYAKDPIDQFELGTIVAIWVDEGEVMFLIRTDKVEMSSGGRNFYGLIEIPADDCCIQA